LEEQRDSRKQQLRLASRRVLGIRRRLGRGEKEGGIEGNAWEKLLKIIIVETWGGILFRVCLEHNLLIMMISYSPNYDP
jgi:hypothetical protein